MFNCSIGGAGGAVKMESGDAPAAGTGGEASVLAGDSVTGTGGAVTITAGASTDGSSTAAGGAVGVTAGASTGGAGGALTLGSGNSASASNGIVTLKTGDQTALVIQQDGATMDIGDDDAFTLERADRTADGAGTDFLIKGQAASGSSTAVGGPYY